MSYGHSKYFLLSLIIRAKFRLPPPRPTLTRGDFFKIESLHHWVEGKPPIENEVDRCNRFCAMLLTDTRTDGHVRPDGRTDTQSDCNKPLAGFKYKQLIIHSS